MEKSVITVIGRDRVGIVYDVSKILKENNLNILNISQQLMDDFFTMIIVVDSSRSDLSPEALRALFDERGEALGLHMRIQHEALFDAMHRI